MDRAPESIYDAFVAPAARPAAFDPTKSPLHGRLLFVVGAPRSGTTWLQQLLYAHPAVATGGESHLFCEGLAEVFGNHDHPNGMSHLSTWVSRPELLAAARAFCDSVFMTQRDGSRPDATVVLEKTPNHRLQARLQAELYPDARYVHIVRDGRDATSSQRELWGQHTSEFADAERAASAWAEAIGDIRAHFGALAFLELRYEDIVTSTADALRRIFDHAHLAYDDALVDAAVEFGRAPVHTSPASPSVGIRKHADDVLAQRAVARVAGDLLVEFGYASRDEVARDRDIRLPRSRRVPRISVRANSHDTESTRRTARAVADAIGASDEASLAACLGGEVDDAMRRLLGGHVAQLRVVDEFALLTVIRRSGERAVLRVVVRKGAVESAELL